MSPIWIGTSGFAYKEWRPLFYPAGMPEKDFLRHYATRLDSVEIDSTFYRMPSAKTIENWRQSTPENFRFGIKAAQQITHRERLKVPSDALQYLLSIVTGLGNRLGAILYQLPPYFKRDDQRLETFLSTLPQGVPAAFEFRHDSWFTPGVYGILRSREVALCIHDADDHTTPLELTAPFTYLRLRRSEYDDARRREWQTRLRMWAENGMEVYAYIKHADNPNAPLIASDFATGL